MKYMLTPAGTGYLGYDSAGVVDEAGEGSQGSPRVMTCSAAARKLRPGTPCWTPGPLPAGRPTPCSTLPARPRPGKARLDPVRGDRGQVAW